MNYVLVLVASSKYHGLEPLTYSSDEKLSPGTIVQVQLRNNKVFGVVLNDTEKPEFKVKKILNLPVSKSIPLTSLLLLKWLSKYYPAPMGSLVSLFIPSTLLIDNPPPDPPKASPVAIQLPELTSEQNNALKTIRQSESRTALIHGDTGTGKTRIYLELAQESLKNGQSVLILTPEIGLTPQLAAEISRSVDSPVLVLHSNLTAQQRRNLWLQILNSSSPLIIIGPRSALFAPVQNLGLIVIDEAHDTSYKQDQLPYYNALRVAGQLAKIHDARLIFGTATPLVNEFFIFQAKKLPIVRLQQTAAGISAPTQTIVVDARDRSQYSQNPYLSNSLLDLVKQNLEKGEQSLLFLNRRGTARIVLCQDCGWESACPKCNVPLTYHGDSHQLRCHTCGFQASSPVNCPKCGSSEILYKSIGTKALVSILERLFPEARIRRFDTDNLKDEKLENHHAALQAGDIDILVGTQVVIKGLDLPKLSLVGVVAADSSLQFPDYTASEQTYQLLSQAIGRVGRGHRPGTVVIQTHNPSNTALATILNKNWDEYYQQQILERKQFMFPPFCFLLTIHGSRKSRSAIIKASENLKQVIQSLNRKVELIGPSPRFKEQSGGAYNWQLTVKSKDRSELLAILPNLPAGWHYNIDPSNLL